MNPAFALSADPRDELASLVHEAGFLFGPRAKGVDLGALARAKEIAGKGGSMVDTNAETGWWQHPVDAGWRTEKPEGQFIVRPLQETQKSKWMPFEKQIDAPDLLAAYPGLRGIKTDMKLSNDKSALGGYYGYDDGFKDFDRVLNIRGPQTRTQFPAPNDKNIRDVAGHEIGHAIQHIEGWGAGDSPEGVYRRIAKQDPQSTRDYALTDLPEAMARHGMTGNPMDILKKNDDAARKLQMWAMFGQYTRSSGEEEANNIMRRLGMSADEIAEKPWWETMSRPFSEQRLTPAARALPKSVGGW